MPAHTLPTVGTQILLRKPVWDDIVADLGVSAARSALASCERLIAGLFPTISGPCDIQDFSSSSEVLKDGSAAIYLYDNVYDGVDLSTGAFDKVRELVDKSLERLSTCNCAGDAGCFRCIANPRVDEPSSKHATRRVLDALRSGLSEDPKLTERQKDSASAFVAEAKAKCPKCHADVAKGDRFCKECGEKLM
jgi:ATP-dependent helicase YprA (DUF1998 family)